VELRLFRQGALPNLGIRVVTKWPPLVPATGQVVAFAGFPDPDLRRRQAEALRLDGMLHVELAGNVTLVDADCDRQTPIDGEAQVEWSDGLPLMVPAD